MKKITPIAIIALTSCALIYVFLKPRQDDIGTIETGKTADLVLLDANPLEDIENTKKINGVFVKGKWFDALELNNMLKDIRQSYSD